MLALTSGVRTNSHCTGPNVHTRTGNTGDGEYSSWTQDMGFEPQIKQVLDEVPFFTLSPKHRSLKPLFL